jgi:arylsulfatase A-like enzyme
MTLKKITSQLLMALGSCLLLMACNPSAKKKKDLATDKRPPNIIYILADDLGYGDLSSYGQTKFNTPNIDKLARAGMKFVQHYSGSTVCAPSRSVLMTGLHTGHTPVRGNKEIQPVGQHPLPKNMMTMSKMFRNAGYVTGAFGKWGLGYPESEGDPLNQGFDRFFGYNCQRYGHNYYPHRLFDNGSQLVLEKNKDSAKGTYAPSLIHEKALAFMEENKNKPFFMYVPTIIPHAELAAPESYMKRFRGKFGGETPYTGVDGSNDEDFRKGAYQSQAEPKAAYAAMITLLDDQIGELMDKVIELGLAENTLIIFTSDNGPHLEAGAEPDYFNSNGPFRGHKRDLYEGGIRVPMIAYWPAKIKPGTTDHVSAFWDVYPTMSELLEQPKPENIDGISFLPTLLGRDGQKEHEYLYWEFHEKGGRQAVRKGNWKAVKYDVLKNPQAPLELYDLREDIGEENNLAQLHPDLVKEMQTILDTARTESSIFTFSSKTYLEK